ncbi:MAG: PH domain-containing protein [Thermogutta sp.]
MSQDQTTPESGETLRQAGSSVGGAPASSPVAGGEPCRPPRRGDPDVELWRGRYSGWAMFPTWVFLVLITGGAIFLGVVVSQRMEHRLTVWAVLMGIVVLLWLYHLAVYLYRRYTVSYRLTTYRFFNEKGLLFRSVNSMEVIDIDDMSLEQNLLERIAGVGRVVLRTKDPSDPFFVIRGLQKPEIAFAKIDGARRDERIRRGINIA